MTAESLRAVVVDDEVLAREGLAADLAALGVDVVAQCDGGIAAMAALKALAPDVLFLDIEMPEMTGFALLEQFEPDELPPVTIFVTAYDQHAIRAFEAQAMDYVLKPVSPARLGATVERARQRLTEVRALRDASGEQEDAGRVGIERLVVRERDGLTVIPTDSIRWIEAEAYYVRIHAAGMKPRLLRERMSVLEQQLDPQKFVRTHRSAIVRLDFIRSVEPVTRYESRIVLRDGSSAPLSKARRDAVLALLERP